jgi:glyceraldehyde-3-phosphate dehydrogenase (NADP+)
MTYALPEFPAIPELFGRILVNGELRNSGYETKPVFSTCHRGDKPLQIGTTPHVSLEILNEAVDAASQAWARGIGSWPTSHMGDRVKAVVAFRDGMVAQREIVCRLLMWEIGKSWVDAQGEFDRTIQYIDDTVHEVKKLDRDSGKFEFAGGIMAQIRRAPLGVTLCMGPFNYPLNETFTTLIPALIMGNTVVMKIPRFGQLLWEPLLESFQSAFPAGVVNIVNGRGREIIEPAVQGGKIDVLAFIGTSRVANKIKVSHPQPFRFRSILSLEAKNAAIVMEDADLDATVAECVRGALSFNGQRCTALKIIFVHKSIATEFTRRLVKKVDGLVAGLPWDSQVAITPLPDPDKPAYLKGLIDDAVKRGAVLCNPERGGKVEGTLFYPAVLAQVPADAKVALEEQFGPVIPIREYENLTEVEEYIVNSPYGNQASLFGRDPQKIGPVIDHLSNQVCRINLNAQCQRGPDVYPYTGRKNSAEGTLSVYDALRSFSIRCMVAAKEDRAGKQTMQDILRADSSRFLSTNILL